MSEEIPEPLTPMMSTLNSITEQVGEHVLQALRQEHIVAVISTIVPGVGPGADRVVSMPLNADMMAGIDVLLHGVQSIPEEEFEAKCIGFQCPVPPPKPD
jgi:hypothetical protein